ncbi:MAG: TIGR02117 family protein [Verrucomicrobiota bacterium]
MNRIFLPILALVIAFMASSCATLPRANRGELATSGAQDNRIYVASHGWHTGIILKPENLNHLMPSLAERFPHADYYEIGWGDAGFYQANKITAKITLNAVFLPSDTVIHLVGLEGDPVEYFSTSKVNDVLLSDEGMKRLCAFVDSSFARDETGRPNMLGHGLYGDSQFYEGQGKYHLFNGCNKWTAKALCSGGVDIEPLFKITSASVMDEIGATVSSRKSKPLHRRGARGF